MASIALSSMAEASISQVSANSDKSEAYAKAYASRVRSFNTDPLHSAAYLAGLVKFIQHPFRKHVRKADTYAPSQSSSSIFLYLYHMSESARPEPKAFSTVDQWQNYIATPALQEQNEVVFLAGRPSALWLNALGAHYEVDLRCLHQHLHLIPNSQRGWHTSPSLPSRSRNVLRLCIPSMIFIGEEDRHVEESGLQEARKDSDKQIKQWWHSFVNIPAADTGRSIVRRANIHAGDCITLEQDVSIFLIGRGKNWTVVIWNDAGNDDNLSYIPVPRTVDFDIVRTRLNFCPVFFENGLSDRDCDQSKCQPPSGAQSRQPLSALSGLYGLSLSWEQACRNPLQSLEELFSFHAAAACQYLNMVDDFIAKRMRNTVAPGAEGTNLAEVMVYNYTQTVLVRHASQYNEVRTFLAECKMLPIWKDYNGPSPELTEQTLRRLRRDFIYLHDRAKMLIALCETAKSTIISNASIEESKRSSHEAKLVTQLSKTTYRLTFIFLPISYVTSVFGMNFRELGQGNLDMWIWAAVTFPLLAICVVLVEFGNPIRKYVERVLKIASEVKAS